MAPLMLAAAAASLVGARLARHVSAQLLRRAFGVLVLASAAWLLGKSAGPLAVAAGLGLAAIAGVFWFAARTRRRGAATATSTDEDATLTVEAGDDALTRLYSDDGRSPV